MQLNKMTEIVAHCQKAQAFEKRPDALVVFKIDRKASRERMRLFGTRGPLGDVLGTGENNAQVGFKADAVIEFLEKEIARERSILIDIATQAAKDDNGG